MRNVTRLFATAMLIGWLFPDVTAIAAPTDGASELQVSAGWFHTQGSDSGSLNVDLSYGYYLTPGWQLGLRQAVNSTFIDDGRDFWVATTVPFINYHFQITPIIVPYIGAFIGAVWNDRDATGTIGPQAGIKFFVHDTTFLNLGYRYELFFDRIRAIDDNASHGNHVFNVGVGFTWGGAPSSKAKP
jgi:Outer membrane protein beta-barrel domain